MIRTWQGQCSPVGGSDISLDYAQITDAAPLGAGGAVAELVVD